jgi:hypothetical protein
MDVDQFKRNMSPSMAAKCTLEFWGEHTRSSLEWGDFLFFLSSLSFSVVVFFFVSLFVAVDDGGVGGRYFNGTADDDNDDENDDDCEAMNLPTSRRRTAIMLILCFVFPFGCVWRRHSRRREHLIFLWFETVQSHFSQESLFTTTTSLLHHVLSGHGNNCNRRRCNHGQQQQQQ